MTNVAAVLLAAGAGARLGHRPKGLLALDGVPLIRGQLRALQGLGLSELVVVTGHHAERVEPWLVGEPITLCRNPAPAAGQNASVRCGLRALAGPLDAVLVTLVDLPLLTTEDFRTVIQAYAQRAPGIELVAPQVNGQPGHPVVFSPAVRAQILAGDEAMGVRQWRQAHPEAAAHVPSDNRHHIWDVDTQVDLDAFERLTGRTLRWRVEA